MPEIKIDKAVPLPRPRGTASMYPWDQMEVGDSFFLVGRHGKSFAPTLSKVNRMKAPKHFTTRKVKGPDGKEGIRVWRVEDTKPNGAEPSAGGGEAGQ